MCGRTACNLAPDVIQKACSYRDRKLGKYKKPEWREHPHTVKKESLDYEYYPSPNVSPTKFTPVLFKPTDSETLVVQPMFWGFIPPWHKGDAKSTGWRTINCRKEGLEDGTSRLFRVPLVKRRTCAIVCQGFYEWKKGAGNRETKQPYFFLMPQDNIDEIWKDKTWTSGKWNAKEGWKGPKLVFLAGLYSKWRSPTDELVYSYTIITQDAPKKYSHIHHRFPAVLETPEQLLGWLSPDPDATDKEILSNLKPPKMIDYYPVTTNVGNSRYREVDAMKRLDLKEKIEQKFFTSPKKDSNKGTSSSGLKKPKLEKEEDSSGDEEDENVEVKPKRMKME